MTNITNSSEKTKEKILQIARKRFSEFCYSSVSMNDIAVQAGISKPALYYYFKSKDDIFKDLLKQGFDEIKQETQYILSLDIEPEEKLQKYLLSFINHAKTQKNVFKLTLQKITKNGEDSFQDLFKFKDDIVDSASIIIEDILKKHNQIIKFDKKIIAFMLMGALKPFLFVEFNDPQSKALIEQYSSEEIVNHLIKVFITNNITK